MVYLKHIGKWTYEVMKGPKEMGSYKDPPFWFGSKEKTLRVTKNAVIENLQQCQLCGARTNLCVHHIIPVSAGGGDHPENLTVLCKSCHMRVHGRSRESGACVLRYMTLKKLHDEALKDKYPEWRFIEEAISFDPKSAAMISKETLISYEKVKGCLELMCR